MGDKVVVLGVLSWTRGDGRMITRRHAEQYGISFSMLHDGPVGAFNRWSPTTIVFDRSGTTVAWARGSYFWDSQKVVALFETLSRQPIAASKLGPGKTAIR